MDKQTLPLSTLPFYKEWPKTSSLIAIDPKIEADVVHILSLMTLEEKIGQMIQPEIFSVTPEEAKDYKIGSILNGAGGWPDENKHSPVEAWSNTIDQYWLAVNQAFEGRPFHIPLLWGTDAVHGHNNAYGATVFPHNIGLGAANDPELIERIGRATAKEIAATGMDWTFAPTVTTPRDLRWGRHYEGYSEDPEIVEQYASRMVKGLQGSSANELKSAEYILSNVKHWLGDGGTWQGIDRGVNKYSESDLLNIHAHGYVSALNAGSQIVMTSFNSWENTANYGISTVGSTYNYKVHGSHYLNTVVLKEKMGFDGIVITDWDGHAEVTDSTLTNANYSIRSGIDILMVASGAPNWKAVYQNLLTSVLNEDIPLARIDDAVSRILRVKMRAGLWEKAQPSQRMLSKKTTSFGCAEHRALAREAVQKSLVLLKNNHNLLPLARTQNLLVTGSAAHDICKQAGGWTLSWQGTDNTLNDFPQSDTLLTALVSEMGKDKIFFDPDLTKLDHYCSSLSQHENTAPVKKVAIVVIGEDSYAEMRGDIKPWRPIIFNLLKPSYLEELKRIETLKKAGFDIITLFFSGRPLGVNQEIHLSDAFVAAWLPGTQAKGITDVLLQKEDGSVNVDFQGKLAFTWPGQPFSYAVNRPLRQIPEQLIPEQEAAAGGADTLLFPYGYGLTYLNSATDADVYLNNLNLIYEDKRPSLAAATEALNLIDGANTHGYQARITGRSSWSGKPVIIVGEELIQTGGSACLKTDIEKGHVFEIHYFGYDFFFHLQPTHALSENLSGYLSANGSIEITIKVLEPPQAAIYLANHNEYPNQPAADIADLLRTCPIGKWSNLHVPLALLDQAGCDFKSASSPFMLYGDTKMAVQIAAVCWSIGNKNDF